MTDNDNIDRRDYAGDAIRWLAAGFGMGLLVGGALGVLLAPKSGQETREQLKVFAGDFQERATTVAGDLRERAQVAASGISERATTTYDKARTTASGIKETTQTVSTQVKDGFTKAKKAGEKFVEGYKKKKSELESETVEEDGDQEEVETEE